jgi:hypothetical protein
MSEVIPAARSMLTVRPADWMINRLGLPADGFKDARTGFFPPLSDHNCLNQTRSVLAFLFGCGQCQLLADIGSGATAGSC